MMDMLSLLPKNAISYKKIEDKVVEVMYQKNEDATTYNHAHVTSIMTSSINFMPNLSERLLKFKTI